MAEQDPGVPEALGRALEVLADRVDPSTIDRVWVFPPLRSGRRETGVIAAGCLIPGERHLLVTLSYRAEETGGGVAFESTLQEEGEAPPERLPRVMEGVVRRLGDVPGTPRSFDVAGDPERFQALPSEIEVALGPLASHPGSEE